MSMKAFKPTLILKNALFGIYITKKGGSAHEGIISFTSIVYIYFLNLP